MMNKILLVKTSSLGDLIHIYPVVAYLRKKFPAVQLDWVVETPFADLVNSHPNVDHALCVSTKVWRKHPFKRETGREIAAFRRRLQQETYDVVFDLQGNVKSGLITYFAKSPCKVGFDRATVPEWPNLLFTNKRINPSKQGNIRQGYLELVASFFNDEMTDLDSSAKLVISREQKTLLETFQVKSGLNVIVCPGSAWRNKQLSPETLEDFLKRVHSFLNCHFSLVWGSPQEKLMAEQLHLIFPEDSSIIDKMTLPMLQNLMAMGDLVIAMDSLPLHLAGTTHTPSFSVFGASSAAKYKPLGSAHHAFQGVCPYGKTFEKRCPILRSCSTGACIRNLQAAELFHDFQAWWTRNWALS
jgi:heptosyltransferase I